MKRINSVIPSKVKVEDSSRIREVEFDPYEKNTSMGNLIVTFVKGAKYKYYNVGREIFVQFVTSQSVGKAFEALVKNQYKYERLI